MQVVRFLSLMASKRATDTSSAAVESLLKALPAAAYSLRFVANLGKN
ncbi:MAG: hypothetical protein II088_07175 [Bacteroidales bacterium]|nr:hypothetical protein [Bacteroidales bacterium]